MKIVVAMSGGVDSSVAALMLKEQGHDVIGVTMLLHDQAPSFECEGISYAARHIVDARRVADIIGIPHHVFDLTKEFSETVIEEFVDSYLRGETPLPCALCNKRIKFGSLMAIAKDLGAEALATGHYARREIGVNGPELHRAADGTRDQSYFLFALDREQLDFIRFPLGGMKSKAETRALAEKYGLSVSSKPDSQDICFVPDGDYAGLVDRVRHGSLRPGDIVDEEGTVLGKHKGIVHFTVGQRRGVNLSNRVGEQNEPLYVVRLDVENNDVVVGPKASLAQTKVFLRDVNWLGDPVPEDGLSVKVKLRSAQAPQPAIFQVLDDARGLVTLSEPVFGVAPGQAGVIYDGTRVLGGGWIETPSF